MLKPSNAKARLNYVISDIASHPEEFVINPDKDMTRNRKCGIESTIKLVLSMNGHSLNTEIYNFFNHKKEAMPTKSAVVQQRHKINDKLFPSIFNRFNESVPFKKLFKNYHLLAIDGSDVNIVTNCDDYEYRVKQARSNGCYYQMHLSAMYDLLEQRYLDAVIQPRPKLHEINAAIEMVKRNPLNNDKCIYICDRGYESFGLMSIIDSCKQYFIIRAKQPCGTSSLLKTLTLPENCEFDIPFSFELARRKKDFRTKSENIIRKALRYQANFPLIPEDSCNTYLLNVRVVCIRLKDSFEYLLTNLPASEFAICELSKLYRMRWDIESSFKALKYALCLTYFHSRLRKFNIQEVYARLIMYNFASLINLYRNWKLDNELKRRHRKYKLKTSFADSIPAIKDYFNNRISTSALTTLLSSYVTEIIPGRAFPRNVRSCTVVTLNNRA